jgi:hypothetical protein
LIDLLKLEPETWARVAMFAALFRRTLNVEKELDAVFARSATCATAGLCPLTHADLAYLETTLGRLTFFNPRTAKDRRFRLNLSVYEDRQIFRALRDLASKAPPPAMINVLYGRDAKSLAEVDLRDLGDVPPTCGVLQCTYVGKHPPEHALVVAKKYIGIEESSLDDL